MNQSLPAGQYLHLCLFYQPLDYKYHLQAAAKQKKNLLGSYKMKKIFLAKRKKAGGMNSNISHLVWKDGSGIVLNGQKLLPFTSAAQTILVPIKQRRENAENWAKNHWQNVLISSTQKARMKWPSSSRAEEKVGPIFGNDKNYRLKEEGGYIYFGFHSSILKYLEGKA